jgi:hypothetical protein
MTEVSTQEQPSQVRVHTYQLTYADIQGYFKKADHTAKQSVGSRIYFASHLETDHIQPERLSLILNVCINFAISTKVHGIFNVHRKIQG